MNYLMWLAIALTAILFGAKLAGAVVCSWWLVFTPLLIVFGLWLAIVLITLAIIGICALIAIMSDK